MANLLFSVSVAPLPRHLLLPLRRHKPKPHLLLRPKTLLSPAMSSPARAQPSGRPPQQWSCARCTLNNPGHSRACEACSSTRPVEVVDAADDDDLDLGALASASFLPLRRSSQKRGRAASPGAVEVRPDEGDGAKAGEDKAAEKKLKKARTEIEGGGMEVCTDEDDGVKGGEDKPAEKTASSQIILDKKAFKIMTYNVWFREDLELRRRMDALADLIKNHNPDLICFQEVTPTIYLLLQKSDWWQDYQCSLSNNMAMQRPYYCMQMSKLPVESFDCTPFSNSIMGRELCVAHVNTGGAVKLVLATSHLESPCPAPPSWDQMYSKERVAQANESLKILGSFRNVIFCGDMNWDDKGDGPFPLPDGWTDAWIELKPGENGWTYDTKANAMLSANRKLQKRMDRLVCKLADFKIDSIQMIGKDVIPGASYVKEKKVHKEVRKLELPVLPSDHFGLVLSITLES
ncbi:hypothetical protein E2562_030530 [Oryza meyeriana var. granulata]|uniref:RanBP2-type domain-containing protein n=1 Tax=Oryza meyeriana var. granulata TaxID=110450 RepID=A0A6G1BPR4_9ORYZ|nr:hypothetical protein E2562_030530 [Oryza meyeriana var. granulata]